MSEDTAPGRLLFSFVRHWSRYAASGDGALATQGRLILVDEAVDALSNRGEAATVNAIAAEIGIDQSGASRLVKNAIAAGHVTLEAPEADARRRVAHLTDRGRTSVDEAHAWQEQVFAELTTGWSPERRSMFAGAIRDLMDDVRPTSGLVVGEQQHPAEADHHAATGATDGCEPSR